MELFRLVGEKLLKRGEPLLAYDIVSQGLHNFPRDLRLRQLQGLALARSGAAERASRILEELVGEGHADTETLGMLGRTQKDRAARARTPSEAKQFLRRAAATYAQAHAISGDYWTGINAATTALLIGERERALALASKVRAACLRELRRGAGDRYWLLATLGEAALIARDWAEANDRYAEAAQIAGRRFGDLQASRRNARLLLDFWRVDPAEVERHLRVPPVAVFAGHMIDHPGRKMPRFPAHLEKEVANLIRQAIARIGAAIGYSSAACGSDILFLEAMLEAKGEIFVALPCAPEDFVAKSIIDESWRRRFDRVLGRATRVVVASREQLRHESVSYDYTNQIILGLARIRAGQLNTELAAIAVWDQQPGDGPGGTASAIVRWRKLGLPIEMIDLSSFSPAKSQPRSQPRLTSRRRLDSETGAEIRAILFADAVGFSKLTEAELFLFVREFMGEVGQLVRQWEREIITRNTWGDCIYLTFQTVQAAGNFALDLSEMISRIDWPKRGLPASSNFRIAVHAGPVYSQFEPIKRVRECFGAHVNQTARIEPIAPPGQVYASEAFAALAAAQNVSEFTCEYAGQVPMAKAYGIYPMYHVRRAITPEPKLKNYPRHAPLQRARS